MEAITCIKERRSIRKFKPEAVEHEVVREIFCAVLEKYTDYKIYCSRR